MEIRQTKWDGEWRIVIFDIPEKFKKAREALKVKIKKSWVLRNCKNQCLSFM